MNIFKCFFGNNTSSNTALIGNDDELAKMKIIGSNAAKYLRQCNEKFDIVYLDPPWDRKCFYADSLKAIYEFDILEHRAIVICEHSSLHKIDLIDNFFVKAEYSYGDTMISILHRKTR